MASPANSWQIPRCTTRESHRHGRSTVTDAVDAARSRRRRTFGVAGSSARGLREGAGARAGAEARDGGELPGPRRLGCATRRSRSLQDGTRAGSGPLHVRRPFHLPDPEPAGRAGGDRLQRLCPAADGARHRHHEPRPFDPLHRLPGSRDQVRAARLGPEPG